jgi:hypothetical protein
LTCVAAALTVAQVQLAALAAEPAAPAAAPAAAAAEQPAFSPEQIEQMVAPVALYPDALLAQVFMSATYPLEIVQAARWVKKNESLKGEALDAALRDQGWDPSVKTLVLFPTVLQRMNDNLDWTQDLGDAFLAQEQEVMDTVQRLRQEAQKTGALKDTPQQKVVVEKETIIVEPAEPQTVYVPTYDPSAVYGQPAPAQPYYPTVYQQPVATTSTTDSAVAFGTGALVGGLLTAAIMWDDDDDWDGYHVWHHGPGYWDNDWPGPRYGSGDWNNWRGDTNINGDVCVGRCTSIEKNEWKRQANNFQHNPEHRGGVKYRDGAQVAARHPEVSRPRQPGGIDRDAARGKERPTTLPATADRRPGTGERPGAGARPAERPKAAGAERARPTDRPQAGGGDRPGAGAKPAERPKVASADRPKAEARPAQRPQAESRPAQRPQAQAQAKAPQRSVSQAPKASKPTAFQSSGGGGSFERQASARGATSRRSGGMRGSGGGGMRGGGGGGRGGGGGGRGGGGRGR